MTLKEAWLPTEAYAPAAAETAAVGRLAFIDAFRGFAAGWVFLLHVQTYWMDDLRLTGINASHLAVFLAGIGGLGVDLFIVLSGFCLFFPLIKKARNVPIQFKAGLFWRRRAGRMLPAYYAALAVAAVLCQVPTLQNQLVIRPVNSGDVLAYSLLAQTFSDYHTPSINGSLWSIPLEAELYLVFPLLLVLYRRGGMRAAIVAGLVAAGVWPCLQSWIVQGTGVPFNANYHFPARWIEFIAGMAAAKAVCHGSGRGKLWLDAGLPLALVATFALHTGLSGLHLPTLRTVAAGACFALLMVRMATVSPRLFMGRWPTAYLARFGAISYSFYLLHQPVLLLLKPLRDHAHLSIIGTFVLAMTTAFPLNLGLAWVFYKVFEVPFLERGKRARLAVNAGTLSDRALP